MSVQFFAYKNGKPAPEAPLFVGAVLDTYEVNGYDDSDWYAIVWDDEKKIVRSVEYDTTRAASMGRADVDATPESMDKARQYARDVVARGMIDDHAIVGPGKTVKSLTTRGKAKGITGTVERFEKDQYHRSYGDYQPKVAVVKVTGPFDNPHYGRNLYIQPDRLEVTDELTEDVKTDYRQEAWLQTHAADFRSLFHIRWGSVYRPAELYR
jgi:hypothetical protein